MKRAGVYCIEFENGQCYYGMARDLDARFYNHEWSIHRGNHPNKNVQELYNRGFVYWIKLLEEYPVYEGFDWETKEGELVLKALRLSELRYIRCDRKCLNVQGISRCL